MYGAIPRFCGGAPASAAAGRRTLSPLSPLSTITSALHDRRVRFSSRSTALPFARRRGIVNPSPGIGTAAVRTSPRSYAPCLRVTNLYLGSSIPRVLPFAAAPALSPVRDGDPSRFSARSHFTATRAVRRGTSAKRHQRDGYSGTAAVLLNFAPRRPADFVTPALAVLCASAPDRLRLWRPAAPDNLVFACRHHIFA
jgi:hypothetical protein